MANEARTVADLERKYNFAEMLGMVKNLKISTKSIIKTQNELLGFLNAVSDGLEDLQDQVDGNITTWFFSGVPTLNNQPASSWQQDEYNIHLGDLYYDTSTGHAYRFALQETTYLWLQLTDSDVTAALALASEAQDTADGKRRVFTEEPTPPYDVGDLYLNNQELYVCSIAKTTGSYASTDFTKATKYTDDSSLTTFVNTTYATAMSNLTNQIDGKISTWYYSGTPTLSNLPASNWTTNEIKAKHTGDLYYDRTTGYSYIFEYKNNAYVWTKLTDTDVIEALALANAAQDTADNKRRIFVVQPTPPYDSGDLWINNNEIYICQTSKAEEQSYSSNDWVNNLKYTDNTVANAIVDELGGTATQVLSGQVVLILQNYAKFTDLATGGSTVINGANISTGTIDTDNVSIGNGNVLMDALGIHLFNGAKVIGRNGLMDTYMKNKEGFVGYFLQDPNQISSDASKQNILMDVIIPPGFEITSAKIIGYHTPIYWGYLDGNYQSHNAWGYARGLKLYKASNIYTAKVTADLFSEYTPTSEATYTEIANALGANGWTATAPNNTTHETEKFESSDVKSIFQDSNEETVAGLYQIKLEPDASPTAAWGTSGVVERSGYVSAILVIEGYMTYS